MNEKGRIIMNQTIKRLFVMMLTVTLSFSFVINVFAAVDVSDSKSSIKKTKQELTKEYGTSFEDNTSKSVTYYQIDVRDDDPSISKKDYVVIKNENLFPTEYLASDEYTYLIHYMTKCFVSGFLKNKKTDISVDPDSLLLEEHTGRDSEYSLAFLFRLTGDSSEQYYVCAENPHTIYIAQLDMDKYRISDYSSIEGIIWEYDDDQAFLKQFLAYVGYNLPDVTDFAVYTKDLDYDSDENLKIIALSGHSPEYVIECRPELKKKKLEYWRFDHDTYREFLLDKAETEENRVKVEYDPKTHTDYVTNIGKKADLDEIKKKAKEPWERESADVLVLKDVIDVYDEKYDLNVRDTEWKKALYNKVQENLNTTRDFGSHDSGEMLGYYLYDIDKDDIAELILCFGVPGGDHGIICKYDSGKKVVLEVGETWIGSNFYLYS